MSCFSPIIFFVRSKGFQHFPWNSITFFHSLSHEENTWHFFFSIPCFGCIILVYGTDGFQIIAQFLSLKSSKVTGSGSSIPGSVPTILSRMGPDFSKGPEYMHIRAHVCKAPTPYSDFCFSFPKQKNTHLLCMHFNKQRTIFQETDVLHKKPHATIFFYLFPVVWGQENGIPLPCNLK